MGTRLDRARIRRFLASLLDLRPYLHLFRLVNYYNYAHVVPRRRLALGADVRISPTATFNHAERITLGDRANIGEGCRLWAGPTRSRITIGSDTMLAPDVFLVASNYRFDQNAPIASQGSDEQDIEIGRDVWLGARVVVVAGVRIGDGCVVGAGSVVTRDLPAGSVAAGAPARVLKQRDGR